MSSVERCESRFCRNLVSCDESCRFLNSEDAIVIDSQLTDRVGGWASGWIKKKNKFFLTRQIHKGLECRFATHCLVWTR